MRLLAQILQPLDENYSSRGSANYGSGKSADFQRVHINYIGHRLQLINDPIVREHFSMWLFNELDRDATALTKKVMTRSFSRPENDPTFQQRHFWFLAWACKSIVDHWMWKFTIEWLEEEIGRTNNQFKPDLWRREATPTWEKDNASGA